MSLISDPGASCLWECAGGKSGKIRGLCSFRWLTEGDTQHWRLRAATQLGDMNFNQPWASEASAGRPYENVQR